MENFPKRLTMKIDVTKIKKHHLFTGKKGVYLNLVLFNTPGNQYKQDFCVKQENSQEAREKGHEEEMEIIGEARAWALGEGTPSPKGEASYSPPPSGVAASAPQPPANSLPEVGSDGLPF